jgi:hypothetical protein
VLLPVVGFSGIGPARPFARAGLVGLATLLASAVASCGGPLGDAESLFKRGQYPAAHQALLGLEVESRSWTDAERAKYALYVGLTLVALGDWGRAGVWLREAKAVEDEHPGSLPYDDARRLAVATADKGDR